MRNHWLLASIGVSLSLSLPTHAQLGTALTVADPSGTTLLNDYSYASKQRRSVQAQGWTLDQRLTGRLFVWYGQQSILAIGQKHGDQFSATSDRYGARLLLSKVEARGWTVGYDGFRPRAGHFIGPNNALAGPGEVTRVQYPATQTDLLNVRYTFGKSLSDNTTLPSGSLLPRGGKKTFLPTYNVHMGLEHVQALGNGAEGINFGGGVLFPIRPGLTADVEITGFAEKLTGGALSSSLKTHLYAGLVYQPLRWVRLVASAEIMPSGLPYGGTSLSGFSSYLLDQSVGAIQGLHNGPVADMNLQLQFSNHF